MIIQNRGTAVPVLTNASVNPAKESQSGFPSAAPGSGLYVHFGIGNTNTAVRIDYTIMLNTMLAMTSTIPPPRREEICA